MRATRDVVDVKCDGLNPRAQPLAKQCLRRRRAREMALVLRVVVVVVARARGGAHARVRVIAR